MKRFSGLEQGKAELPREYIVDSGQHRQVWALAQLTKRRTGIVFDGQHQNALSQEIATQMIF